MLRMRYIELPCFSFLGQGDSDQGVKHPGGETDNKPSTMFYGHCDKVFYRDCFVVHGNMGVAVAKI